jgi:hypothetical protein
MKSRVRCDYMMKAALENYGCTAAITNDCLSNDQIIAAIDKNHPIIVGFNWADGGGHAMVIGGYSNGPGGVWLNLYDPAETAVQRVHADALRRGNYAGQIGDSQGGRSNKLSISLECRTA